LNENRRKSGIYRLNNLRNNKSYVGSSICLSDRFNNYYSLGFLNRKIKKGSSAIYSALLKYGYSNFSLDILEYCIPNMLIKREQYYIDCLKPEYNILKIAGSRLGSKHSEATKQLLSTAFTGRTFSEDSLNKMRLAAKLRARDKMSLFSNRSVRKQVSKTLINKFSLIKIIDITTNTINIFRGNKEAANFLDMGESTLRRYKKRGKLYKNTYLICNSKDL
jgi:group I intron endonuclease